MNGQPNDDPYETFPDSELEEEEEEEKYPYNNNPYNDPRYNQNPYSPQDPRNMMMQSQPNQVSQQPNPMGQKPNENQLYGGPPQNQNNLAPNQPMNNYQQNPWYAQRTQPNPMNQQQQQPFAQNQPSQPIVNQVGNPNYSNQPQLAQPNPNQQMQQTPNRQWYQPQQQQQQPSQQLPNQQQHPGQQFSNQLQPGVQQFPNRQWYQQHPSQLNPGQQPTQLQPSQELNESKPQESSNQMQSSVKQPNQQIPNQMHPEQEQPKLQQQPLPQMTQSQPKEIQTGQQQQPQPSQISQPKQQDNPIQASQIHPSQQPTNQVQPIQQQPDRPQSQLPNQIQPIQRQILNPQNPNLQQNNQPQPNNTQLNPANQMVPQQMAQSKPNSQNPHQTQPGNPQNQNVLPQQTIPSSLTTSPQMNNFQHPTQTSSNAQPSQNKNPATTSQPQQINENLNPISQKLAQNPELVHSYLTSLPNKEAENTNSKPSNNEQVQPQQLNGSLNPISQKLAQNPDLIRSYLTSLPNGEAENTNHQPPPNKGQSQPQQPSGNLNPLSQKLSQNPDLVYEYLNSIPEKDSSRYHRESQNADQTQPKQSNGNLSPITKHFSQNPELVHSYLDSLPENDSPPAKNQPTNPGQNHSKLMGGPLNPISQHLTQNPDLVHSYLDSMPNNDPSRESPQQNLKRPVDPLNQADIHHSGWYTQQPSSHTNQHDGSPSRNNHGSESPERANNTSWHIGNYYNEPLTSGLNKNGISPDSKQTRPTPPKLNPQTDPVQSQPRYQRMLNPYSHDQPSKNGNEPPKQVPFRSFGEAAIPQNKPQPDSASQSPTLKPQNRWSNPAPTTHVPAKPETQFYNPRHSNLNPKDPQHFPSLIVNSKNTEPRKTSNPHANIDHPLTQKNYKNYPVPFTSPDSQKVNQGMNGDSMSHYRPLGKNQRPQLNHRRVIPQEMVHGRSVSPISGAVSDHNLRTVNDPNNLDTKFRIRKTMPDVHDTLPYSIQGTVPTKRFDPHTYSEPKYNEFSTKIDHYDSTVTVDPISITRSNQNPHHLPNVYSRHLPLFSNSKLLIFDRTDQNPLIKDYSYPNRSSTYNPNAFRYPTTDPTNYFLKPEAQEPANRFPQPAKTFDIQRCLDIITSSAALDHLKDGQPLEFIFNKVKIPNDKAKARITKRIFEMCVDRVDVVRKPSHIRSLCSKFMQDLKINLTELLHYLESVLNDQEPMRLDLHSILEILSEFYHFMGFFMQHDQFFNYYDRWWRTPRDDEYIAILKNRLEQAANTLRNDVNGIMSPLKDPQQKGHQQSWNQQRAWGGRELKVLATSRKYLSHLYYQMINKKQRLLSGL